MSSLNHSFDAGLDRSEVRGPTYIIGLAFYDSDSTGEVSRFVRGPPGDSRTAWAVPTNASAGLPSFVSAESDASVASEIISYDKTD